MVAVSGYWINFPASILAMFTKFSSKSPSWFSASSSIQDLFAAAAQSWNDAAVSEQYIEQALAQADVGFDVLIGAYRYYFYRNQLSQALQVATTVCDRICSTEQWPTEWPKLQPLLMAHLDVPAVRLYLSAYVASGLVLARLGRVEEAQRVANQVQQLGAKEFGAELLLNILSSAADEEE